MRKLIVLMALIVSGATMAQQGERQHRKNMEDMTPEQMATLRTKHMTLALDLNDEQQKKVQTLNLENATLMKAKMEQRKAKAKNGEKPSKDERYANENQRLDRQIAMKKKMKDILTDEQYTKWEKMQGEARKGKQRSKGKERPQEGKRN